MQIHESAEMYLETILVLQKRLGDVRSIDIANEMHFSKPTISIAMKKFKEEGYIHVDSDGYITLSEKGLAIANRVLERHEVLSAALIALGVDEETAKSDACKMEHDISEKTFSCIKEFLNNTKK